MNVFVCVGLLVLAYYYVVIIIVLYYINVVSDREYGFKCFT